MMMPAGWYEDPEDATRLRRWDGAGWTDAWMRNASAAATASGTATAPRAVSPRLPAPGWQPDPGDPTRSRFWDGTSWTERVRQGRGYAGRTTLGRGYFTLSTGVQVALVVAGVVGGLVGIGAAWSYRVADRWLQGSSALSQAEARALDVVTLVGSAAELLVFAVTAVLFVVWLHRTHGSDRVDPAVLSHGRAWTLWAWVVPVIALWWPLVIVTDVWTGARSATGRSGRIPGVWRLYAWWAAWLLMIVANQVSYGLFPASSEDDPVAYFDGVRASAVADIVFSLSAIVAAGLAVLVVRGVTDALRRPEGVDPLPVEDVGAR